MPKVTQEYRDARREQILTAARRCFLRDGFHATSMQDLFAEAELSSGAVYRYFASKDDVIIAIAQENLGEILEMVGTRASTEPDSSIGSLLAAVFDVVRTKNAQDGLAGLAVLVWSESLRNPTLSARFRELLLAMHADLDEIVRRHQKSGDLPSEVPTDSISALIFSVIPGYILQLAILGPDAVAGIPDAARGIWPPSTQT